jgi:3-hydroxyacyl-CoA dehydrogenase/enoyl-CoA hydratase/3-hydroxybutyryl-CoA epimerase
MSILQELSRSTTDADGIALVTWDMPGRSMNVFDRRVMARWTRSSSRSSRRRHQGRGHHLRQGLFLRRRRPEDAAGELSEFLKRCQSKDLEKATQGAVRRHRRDDRLFRKLETCGKPWVAAINGTCMGGAFELSLACHGRVAAN